MSLKLRFTPRAAREIRNAAEWWILNRTSVVGAVHSDLAATLAILREQPDIGIQIDNATSGDVRRFYLDRISYWVYYRVRDEQLQVLSIWHASRGSDPAL